MGCCAVSGSREEDWNLIKVKKTKRRISENKNIDIRKNYDFISTLGNGAFGKVRLYRDKNNKNLLYAIKTLKKSGISDFEFDLIKNEIEILSNMDHPNIVKYFGVYEDEYHIHILMEYLKGYDLSKIITLKQYNTYDEKNICEIICQLLNALYFLHNQNIVHRDIKPENILFADKRDFSTLKLVDFGLATNYHKNSKTVVGTPYYMAPEMIEGNFYPQSDIWSLGIIVYFMFTGKHPFEGKTCQELFNNIKFQDLNFLNLAKLNCSDEAKDFILKCLQKNYKERIKTAECLDHPWINKFNFRKNSNLINNETIDTLLDFANKNPLQKEIYFFLAKISPENDINKLKEFFISLDHDNSGTLTINEIEKAFQELKINIDKYKLRKICNGLDFHKDGQIKYSEFLAAMVSSYNFKKEDKLRSVFNLFKQGSTKENFITFDSILNAVKALNLNVNENDIKKCLEQYNEEIDFNTFKKMIFDYEEKNGNKTSKSTDINNKKIGKKVINIL